MPPPELTRNTPVLDVFHPLVIGIDPLLRDKFHITRRYGINSTLGNRYAGYSWFSIYFRCFCHRHKPLIGQHRLYDLTGSRANRHHIFVRHGFLQEALCFQIIQNSFAAVITVHALISSGAVFVDLGVQSEDGDQRQVVALATSIVVEVMCARDFDAATAKFTVHKVVRNHWDFAVTQWQINKLTDQMFVTFVFRVNAQGAVGQHGFWTGGGDVQSSHRCSIT